MKTICWLLVFALTPLSAATVQVQVLDGVGKPLSDAAVYLQSREVRLAVKPAVGAEITQSKKQFDPRVLVVPIGTTVAFPNRDTVRHHVYSFSPTKTFEIKLYTGSDANPVLFDRAGIAVLGCNIHDNMAAWVVVVDTPYFGRSAQAGTVVIDNVPAGNYVLRVWHPAMAMGAAPTEQALVVGSGDVASTVRLSGLTQ